MQITSAFLTRRLVAFPPGKTRFLICLLLLGICALPYVFLQGFTGLPLFDDEGTLMITFRDLEQGLHLYDESYALYGPFYYLSVGALFTKLHLTLTHDTMRLISSVCRIAAAGLLGTLTFRLTRSTLAGLFTSLSLLVLYWFMPTSPTHPEEICLLLIAIMLHLMLSIGSPQARTSLVLSIAVGACLAALVLTKINVGVFAGVALCMTGLGGTPDTLAVRLARGLMATSAILLPLLLMQPLLNFLWVRMYCLSATATIAAAVVVWLGSERFCLKLTHSAVCAAAALTAGAILVGATLAAGSSLYGILNGVVLQNSHFIRNWYVVMPFSYGSIGAGVVALVAAFLTRGRRNEGKAIFLKFVVGTGGMLGLLLLIFDASKVLDVRLWIIQFVTPFSFLVLIPTGERTTIDSGRMSVGLLATTMVLYAFPVGGAQIGIAESLTVAYLPLLFQEGLLVVRPRLTRALSGFPYAIGAGCLAVALCLGGLFNQTRHAWWRWGGGVSSGLPGAALIHVPSQQRDELQRVVRRLSTCPAFYTFPGMMSFYLWTDRPSPTAVNSNDTLGLLTSAQQNRVIADLTPYQNLCVIFSPELLEGFDRGQIASKPPLLRYLTENFTEVEHDDPYVILTPTPH